MRLIVPRGIRILYYRISAYRVLDDPARIAALKAEAAAEGRQLVFRLQLEPELSHHLPFVPILDFPEPDCVPGVSYVFAVNAVNAVGEGPATHSNDATPYKRNRGRRRAERQRQAGPTLGALREDDEADDDGDSVSGRL